MPKVITPALLRDIDKSLNLRFNKGRVRVPGFARRICSVMQSSSAEELYGWIKDLPGLEKNPAEITAVVVALDGHSIKNDEFVRSITIPRSAVEDDRDGVFGSLAEEFGQKGAQRPDIELIAALLASFTTLKAWTTKALFATDHKIGKITFSNKGTKKLSAANYEAGIAVIRGAKDGGGDPLFTLSDSSKVFLVVGENYEATGKAIVKTATLAAGGDNPNYNTAELVVIPGLGDAWFILDNSPTVGGLIFQDRIPLSIVANFNPASQEVLQHNRFSWNARSRFAIGAGRPEYCYGSTGADAA
ncbi:MAG: Mu-like prophage major head subunit gpT family protein [Verrucomicrobiota bacterium]